MFSPKTPNKERILNMRTKELCHKLLSNTSIHKKRVKVISEVIETILIAKKISVTKVALSVRPVVPSRSGRHSETEKSLRNSQSASEPWLLFSSLDLPAEQIIKAYKNRMTIEENFRDLKSSRNGFGMEMTHSKSKKRYKIMLLLARLAATIAYVIGFLAEMKGFQRHFQSCSTQGRRMLSRVYLGCELIYKGWSFRWRDIKMATNLMQDELYALFKG